MSQPQISGPWPCAMPNFLSTEFPRMQQAFLVTNYSSNTPLILTSFRPFLSGAVPHTCSIQRYKAARNCPSGNPAAAEASIWANPPIMHILSTLSVIFGQAIFHLNSILCLTIGLRPYMWMMKRRLRNGTLCYPTPTITPTLIPPFWTKPNYPMNG